MIDQYRNGVYPEGNAMIILTLTINVASGIRWTGSFSASQGVATLLRSSRGYVFF